MASLVTNPSGSRRVVFSDVVGARRTILLGKIPKTRAESIKAHIESLIDSQKIGDQVAGPTRQWVAELDGKLLERLVAAGLVMRPERIGLSDFVDDYIESRTDAAPNTIKKWRTTANELIAYFDAEKPIDEILPADVTSRRQSLSEGRAENTIRKHIAVAKVFFNHAVRAGLIDCSPFDDQPASILPNDSREHFVTRETAAKVLETCPDAEWRL
ncbi:phage integrase SAM-like domain-containing protein [Pirellulales bacterium]|nr:phage integrase SAM-like domain-containing protein [Pirellulales bacterium]